MNLKPCYLFSPQTTLLVFIMDYVKYSFGVTCTMSSTLHGVYYGENLEFQYTVGRIYGLLPLCSVFIVIGIGRDLYNSSVGKTCLHTHARTTRVYYRLI
jgi:hypothetical protein